MTADPSHTPHQPLATNAAPSRATDSAAGPPSPALASAAGPPIVASTSDGSGECVAGFFGNECECIQPQPPGTIVQNARLSETPSGTLADASPIDTKSNSLLVDSQPPIAIESHSNLGGEGGQIEVGGLVGIHSPSQPKNVPKEISESKLGNKRSGKLEKKNNVLYIARKKREYWAKLMKEDEVAAEEYKGANGWAWAVRDGSKDRRPVEGVVGEASPKVSYVSGDGGGGSLSTYEEGNGGSYVSEGKLAEIVAGAVAKAVAEALAGVTVKDSGKLVEEKIIRWTGSKENVVWNEGEEEVEVVGAPRNQFMRMVRKGDGSIGEMWCRGKLDKMVGWRVGVTVIDGKMNLAGRYGRNGGRVG